MSNVIRFPQKTQQQNLGPLPVKSSSLDDPTQKLVDEISRMRATLFYVERQSVVASEKLRRIALLLQQTTQNLK